MRHANRSSTPPGSSAIRLMAGKPGDAGAGGKDNRSFSGSGVAAHGSRLTGARFARCTGQFAHFVRVLESWGEAGRPQMNPDAVGANKDFRVLMIERNAAGVQQRAAGATKTPYPRKPGDRVVACTAGIHSLLDANWAIGQIEV